MFILLWFIAIVLVLSPTIKNGVNANILLDHFADGKMPFWVSPPWMQDEPLICNTTGCIRTAKRLMDYMDLNANPCEDFYRFACGKFLDNTEMPSNARKVSAKTITQDTLNQQLHTILSEPPAHDESWPHRAMRRLFDQCMDEDSLDHRGVAPALRVLEEAGGWPVLGRWDENLHFVDIVIRLKKLGLVHDSLIAVGITHDPRNNSKYTIVLTEPILPLEPHFLFQGMVKGTNHAIAQAYYDFMVDIAVMLGADRAVAEQDMWDCLHLQIELAKMSWMGRWADHGMITIKLEDIQNVIPWVDWVKLIKYTFPAEMRLTMEEPIFTVGAAFYLMNEHLIQYTPKRTLANYLLWSVAHTITPRLTRAMRERHQRFLQVLTGVPSKSPRWKTCIHVTTIFSHVMSSLYVKRFFNESSRRIAEEIITYTTRQMENNLKTLDWMDRETRSQAISKLKSMKRTIGYADEILNNEMLEDYYGTLELNENYFEALLNFSQWARERMWNNLRKEVEKNDWRELGPVTEVNAYCSLSGNALIFPAGILQPPFLSADVPGYVNYATIGNVIGHEIVHGFDKQGSMFDKDGHLHNWWEEESQKHFDEKKQCFIDQYSGFKDEETGLHAISTLTQREIIADNGGLNLAYRSWELSRIHYTEEKLPGFEYFDISQLFMLITANLWCEKYQPQFTSSKWATVYPPGMFRVKVMVKNFPEFQKVFKCAKWKQTTEKACTLW